MDQQIKHIIEMREKLGWTLKELAEKADLFYDEAVLVEKKGIYSPEYVSKLYNVLDEALKEEKRLKEKTLRKKLTKEYLINEYVKNEKSLNDIAQDCACTRQYVYKKLKNYQII